MGFERPHEPDLAVDVTDESVDEGAHEGRGLHERDDDTVADQDAAVEADRTGEPVSATLPYAEMPHAEMPPPNEIAPEYQEALAKEEQVAREAVIHSPDQNGTAPQTTSEISSESEQAPIHHG